MTFEFSSHDRALTYALKGRLSHDQHLAFRDILNRLENVWARHVTLDLSGLEDMNAAGLGMLMLAQTAVERKSGRLTLSGPKGAVRDFLEATRADELFPIRN